MQDLKIPTILGIVSAVIDTKNDSEYPIVFLHGVFLSKALWMDYRSDLTNRTHIYIDMPAHGSSENVGKDWTLNECAQMLIEILDYLKINRCVAVGHSWGSMTVLRAASRAPDRFAAIGLFNMPYKRTTGIARVGFAAQKMMTIFPRFYAKQAAKALYTPSFLVNNQILTKQMQDRLAERPPKEIARTIDAVILNAENTSSLISNLKVPALAITGKTDYVEPPIGIDSRVVPGGHISPHEAQQETMHAIMEVLQYAARSI